MDEWSGLPCSFASDGRIVPNGFVAFGVTGHTRLHRPLSCASSTIQDRQASTCYDADMIAPIAAHVTTLTARYAWAVVVARALGSVIALAQPQSYPSAVAAAASAARCQIANEARACAMSISMPSRTSARSIAFASVARLP